MLLVPGDPDCRSAGSFFKNPIVTAAELARIAAAAGLLPDTIPQWAAAGHLIKLPAAWLLERAGFRKGYAEGAAGLSSRHTLALINKGSATCADIERLQDHIVATVQQRFNLTLEREPVLLG
jgi:UDP-N-acetylmuramate dehydrogenase